MKDMCRVNVVNHNLKGWYFMKRFFILFLALISLSAVAFAAETVAQMTYMVKMPDVIREGKYTGEVENGVPHGYGVFVTQNSAGVSWHYVGQWDNGVMSGQGGQYWDTGKSTVGTFENNSMASGEMHQNASFNVWVDYRDVVDGCFRGIEYREDGSIFFDGYLEKGTNKYKKGTFYTKEGKVFFSGEIGEGFNLNQMYLK